MFYLNTFTPTIKEKNNLRTNRGLFSDTQTLVLLQQTLPNPNKFMKWWWCCGDKTKNYFLHTGEEPSRATSISQRTRTLKCITRNYTTENVKITGRRWNLEMKTWLISACVSVIWILVSGSWAHPKTDPKMVQEGLIHADDRYSNSNEII